MSILLYCTLFVAVLFLGMLAFLELGRRWGLKRLQRDPEGARAGVGAIEGAVFALLGLIIAFTFSGAWNRFEVRRELVLTEANAIGTAWLRLDLLPSEAQPALRTLFREYVDSRLAVYRLIPDLVSAKAELERSLNLQQEIWSQSVTAARAAPTPVAATVLLPALNEMFDIVTTRTAATNTHPPLAIYGLLFALSLSGALFAGAAMAGAKRRSWLHHLGFAVVMAACVYIILDLEFPRIGFIRVDAVDRLLVDVRAGMQ